MTARSPLLALALAAAVAAAGCGTKQVDTDKAESEIEKGLKEQLRVEQVEVTCPDDVEAKADDTFRCTAKSRNETAPISVTQVDDDGNIRWRLR